MGIASCLAAALLFSRAGAQEELCPPAPDARRSAVMDGVSLQAPASAEEETALLERVRSAEEEERLHAIVSLAFGGSLEAFELLLESEDANGLSLFGSFYLNADGTTCLDARVEAALLARLQDPVLGKSLLSFLRKNFYRSRELFDALRRMAERPGEPDELPAIITALTATNREGVEEEVLAEARRLLPHETPVEKRVRPHVHRRFVEYFGRRGEIAAIPYMQELLRIEGYAETNDYFRSKYSETRSLVYHTLDTFPSELVGEVFLEQLATLVQAPRDVLTPYELWAFGDYAVKHAITVEQRERLSDYLSRLMEPEGDDLALEYKIRDRVLALQATIATRASADHVLAELERLVDASTGQNYALLAKTMQALAALPPEVSLDVPRFLASASKLPPRDRLLLVPQVLDRHPHERGHAFYLTELDRVLEAAVESEPGFEERYGLEFDVAFEIVFRSLLGFDGEELLGRTRDRLDGLYLAQRIENRLYASSSKRLNDMLGNKSPLFVQVVEEQEREERRQRQADKEAEWRREQEELVAANTSAQGIQAHIQALAIASRREDVVWLLIAGPDILPHAHAALRDPDSSLELKVRLMDVLGAIGDRSSAEHIIAAARAADEPGVMKPVFLALSMIPATQASADFAAEQLEGERSSLAQSSALVYFALQRDGSARDLARTRIDSADPLVRTAAVYCAARIGDEEALPRIVSMLETDQDRSRRGTLLRALAEVTTPERFEELVPPIPRLRQSAEYAAALRRARFRSAQGTDKTALAIEWLEDGERLDRIEAVRFLLEQGRLDVLEQALNVYPTVAYPLHAVILSSSIAQIVLVEGRRLGFEIQETPEGFLLAKKD